MTIGAPTISIPALSISPEKVYFIATLAREFDVKDDVVTELDQDLRDDASQVELRTFINKLTLDEQVDLVALTWLGRDDAGIDDWNDLRAEAARAHNKRTAQYLMSKPQLADYLEEALEQFGCSRADFEP